MNCCLTPCPSLSQASNQSGSAGGGFGSQGGGRDGVSLAGVTPEVMTAAAQVLQNINKQVGLANLPLTNRPVATGGGSVASQLHQLAAARAAPSVTAGAYKNNNPFTAFGGGYGKKPTPEGDRYGRPMGRSSGHHDNMSHGGNRGELFKRM